MVFPMSKLITDNPRLMDEYRARINRVMDHVEASLASEFTLDELARVAGFSRFHFNRIFHALTGESLFTFIQRIRVERAAAMLLNNRSRPITDIAYDCGFSSSAAFSRSFRNRFGMTATQWRKSDKLFTDIDSGRPRVMDGALEFVEPETVEVKEFPARTLAYVRYTGPYKGDAELFARLFNTLFQWAVPRNLVDPASAECFALYHDSIDITESGRLRVSACVPVSCETRASGEVGIMKLDGGRHVCATFQLDASEYAGAWCWVFNRFFPTSGYQPADGLSFEQYPAQDFAAGGTTRVHICVPVNPL